MPTPIRSLLPCLLLAAAPLWAADDKAEPPLTTHIGPFTLYPFGFLESIGALRSETTHDDISTRFGSFPLADGPGENLNSFRNSRMALRTDVGLGPGKFSVYLESDFLNRPPQQPYRWRQYFGQYTWGDWDFSVGQEWSLLRPSRIGISTITSLMNTHVVDAGYHVGLLGYRDRQVRVLHRMGSWRAALTFENGRDFIPKLTHDSPWLHWELMGVAGRYGHRGASVAGVVHAGHRLDIVTQQYWSHGGGKDALGAVPVDVLACATLEGVEAKVGYGFEIFAYGGLVYGGRSDGNRRVREGTLGLTRRMYRDKIGPLVFSAQYSQLDRALWSGPHGAMHFTMLSLRQYVGNPQ